MRKLIYLLVLLGCLSAFFGCAKENIKNDSQGTQQQVQLNTKQNFIIYRAAANGTEVLLPEKIQVDNNGKPIWENALIALVTTKPQDAKYDDVVPIGTKLLGLTVKDGLAQANFSKELAKKGQGSYQEMMLVYAIVNTLTEFPEIKKVQILLEGKKALTLSGHMDIEEPLSRNITLLTSKVK